MGADLLEDGASVVRSVDARKDSVFAGFRASLDEAMKDIDRALYDLNPQFRDLFAGVSGRVKKFNYRGSSSAGRKNPITKLGETTVRGTRTPSGGLKVDPSTLEVEIEFRRSARFDEFMEWNQRGLAAQKKGDDALRKFFDEYPRPVMGEVTDADVRDLAETVLHELTHAIDDLEDLALREKIVRDGIQERISQVYSNGNGDPAFWYAASDPAEGVAELARMYVYGTEGSTITTSNVGSLTGKAWRETYPDLADWVEKEVFGKIDPGGLQAAEDAILKAFGGGA